MTTDPREVQEDLPTTEPTTAEPVRSAYRWVILLACWAAFTMVFVNRTAWAVVAVDASRSLGLAVAELGVFATALTLGYVVSSIPGGVLTDRFGPRRTLFASILGLAVLTFLFGSTTSVVMGMVLQFLTGLVSGADLSACATLISSWFRSSARATAMGLFITSTAFGAMIANAVVPSLLGAVGWHGVYRVLGAITLVVAVLCLALLRERKASAPPPVPVERGTRRIFDLRPLLHNRSLLFVALAGLGLQWGTIGLLSWANALMITSLGVTAVTAGGVMAVASAIGIGVKPAVGLLSDRLGRRRKPLIMVMSGLFVAVLVAFGFTRDASALLWFGPLLGLAAYGYTPLTNTIVPELAAPEHVGAAVGAVNTVWQIGATLAPVAIGAAYAASGSLQVALLVMAIGPVLGIVMMIPVREHREAMTNGA